MYGWFGDYGPRNEDGAQPTNVISTSVKYITYTDTDKESLAESVADLHGFDFGITLDDTATEEPGEKPANQLFNVQLTVVIVSVAGVLALVIILTIILIAKFGRRRQPK